MGFVLVRHLAALCVALALIGWATLIAVERGSRWSRRRRVLTYGAAAALTAAGVYVFSTINPRAELLGRVVWDGPRDRHAVALTFDDGPNPPYTEQILDILARRRIHATFFLIGRNVETYPDLTQRIVREGHAIGSHTYDHPDYMALDETPRAIARQIRQGVAAVDSVSGTRTWMFRPPLGFRSPPYFAVARQDSLTIVEWTVRALDTKKPPPRTIVHRLLAGVRNGAIILLHDGDETNHGGDRSRTVAALEPLLDSLAARGYECVTVPELLDVP
jgi:peptidoglycan-N-acetylglucosamine deacetylase